MATCRAHLRGVGQVPPEKHCRRVRQSRPKIAWIEHHRLDVTPCEYFARMDHHLDETPSGDEYASSADPPNVVAVQQMLGLTEADLDTMSTG